MDDQPRRRKKMSTAEPVQPSPMPPADATTILCTRCGGHYLDYPAGHEAHKAVFGHQPLIGGA